MLADVGPIPANSGQVTTRCRLNRYGERQLNNALHTVVQSRIQYQPATRDYVARRTAEGKTGRETKRFLARYVARDLYRVLETRPHLLDEAEERRTFGAHDSRLRMAAAHAPCDSGGASRQGHVRRR